MNPVTRKIRDKGYNLGEFCKLIGYSLRWYREYANTDTKQGDKINEFVSNVKPRDRCNGLEDKS